MKILISTTSDVSAGLIKGQGGYFREKGHEVIYSTCEGKKARDLSKEEGLIFVPVPFVREINIPKDFLCLLLACKVLVKHKPDIVNAGTPKAGLIYMIAARITGIKIRIYTMRGLRSSTLTGSKKRLVRAFEKLSCFYANKVIAISPSLKQEAVSLKLAPPEKIVVLTKGSSNGINLKRFSVTDEVLKRAEEQRKEFGIADDTFIFGFVGRIVRDKGIEEIIDAFERIQKIHKVRLILIGIYEPDDPIGTDYVQRIKDNADICEIGYTDQIPAFCYMFDVFMLPSYREGFGNVVIEAAAMGTPAIVSDIPGARDTIENGRTGLLIKPHDADSLYDAMKYYIENKDALTLNGKNAQERVEKYFGNEVVWGEQERLYNTMLSGNEFI